MNNIVKKKMHFLVYTERKLVMPKKQQSRGLLEKSRLAIVIVDCTSLQSVLGQRTKCGH